MTTRYRRSMLSITLETPRSEDVAALLRQSDDYTASLYPPESRHQPDLAGLSSAGVLFFVARLDGAAVGCGALVLHESRRAELKGMFVDRAARGLGVGRALLEALEEAARSEAVGLVQLETGIHNLDAIRLYRRCGYRQRGQFGDYPADPLSLFMEKLL
jgi:putative acetyltransferase